VSGTSSAPSASLALYTCPVCSPRPPPDPGER
jgi:hypothetical protein